MTIQTDFFSSNVLRTHNQLRVSTIVTWWSTIISLRALFSVDCGPGRMAFVITTLFVFSISADDNIPTINVKKWDDHSLEEWDFKDRERQFHDGTIEIHDGIIRLIDDTNHQPDFAEVSLSRKLVVPARFAIEFRCRLVRLGLTDQGTGHKSLFQLLLGVTSPSGPFGVNINLTHDRYNLEANTKVYRTDGNWHTWRLEVDTQTNWFLLFRDGQYVGLHEAQSKQAEGLRLRVQGSSDAPAEVEIAEFSIQKLPELPPPHPDSSNHQNRADKLRPGDWPVWRRDPGNTGISPLIGSIKSAPEIRWSIPVGSAPVIPYWIDLDGDGRVEGLVNHKGTLAAWRLDGHLLWKRALENIAVFGLHDLDADGRQELVIAAGVPSQVQILDARTGEQRYRCIELPLAGASAVRVAKLNSDLQGSQAVVWSPMHEVGYCLSFAEGVEKAKVEWRFDWKHRFFHPTTAFADMNRDAVLDLIVVTYSHAFVFDGRTGDKLMELEWNAGRNYGSLVVRDLDADGFPEIVVLAGQLREHISVLRNEGGKSLKLLWDKFYEQNYPEDFVTLRTLTRAVGDFDSDGTNEIAYSVWDERIDRHWRTIVVDALTGMPKAELLGAYLAGVADIDGRDTKDLLISEPDDRENLNLNQLTAWRSEDGRWKKHSTLPSGTILYAEQFNDEDLSTWSQERHLLHGATSTPWRSFAGSSPTDSNEKSGIFLQPVGTRHVDFIRHQSGRGWQTEFQIKLPEGNKGSIRDVVRVSDQDKEPSVVVADDDGTIRLFDSASHPSGFFQPQAGAMTIPVLARLKVDEMPSIVFFTPSGELQCYRADGPDTPPVRRWSRPGSGIWSLYTPLSQPQGIACIGEVRRGKGLEILVAEKPNRLVALNSEGEVRREWIFPTLPQQWQIANFDGDEHPDLLVTYPTGAIIDVDSVAIRGVDDSMLWKMHCGNGPSAIADVNADGIDDVVMRDLYERRILDGRTGRDLQPIEMTAGYHTPLLSYASTDHRYSGVLWGGGTYSIGFNDPLGQSIWKHWYAPQGTPALARGTDGRTLVGSMTAGQIYQLPDLKPLDSPDKELLGHDLETGDLRWSLSVGATTSGIISADLDGDGQLDFLLGTADGRLLAISAATVTAQRRLWQLQLPGTLGVPIICDDGEANALHILISCADGRLYCLAGGDNR